MKTLAIQIVILCVPLTLFVFAGLLALNKNSDWGWFMFFGGIIMCGIKIVGGE